MSASQSSFQVLLQTLSHKSPQEIHQSQINELLARYESEKYQCNSTTHKQMSSVISASLQNGQRVKTEQEYMFLTRMLHLVSSDFIFPSYEQIIGHIGVPNMTDDGLLFSYDSDKDLLKISQISQGIGILKNLKSIAFQGQKWSTKAHIHLVNGKYTPYFFKRPKEKKSLSADNPITATSPECSDSSPQPTTEFHDLLVKSIQVRCTSTGIWLKNRAQYHQMQQYFPEIIFPAFSDFSLEVQDAFREDGVILKEKNGNIYVFLVKKNQSQNTHAGKIVNGIYQVRMLTESQQKVKVAQSLKFPRI